MRWWHTAHPLRAPRREAWHMNSNLNYIGHKKKKKKKLWFLGNGCRLWIHDICRAERRRYRWPNLDLQERTRDISFWQMSSPSEEMHGDPDHNRQDEVNRPCGLLISLSHGIWKARWTKNIRGDAQSLLEDREKEHRVSSSPTTSEGSAPKSANHREIRASFGISNLVR